MENTNEPTVKTPPPLTLTNQADLSRFDKYYQEEFRKIIESNGKYKGKWNWYSFLFTTLWCLSKGCWVYALIIILSLIITYGTDFYGLWFIGWMVIMGLRGTWLLYNVQIKQKQFPTSLF